MFPFVPLDLCHHHGKGISRLDFWFQEKGERYIEHNQGAPIILVETSLDKLTTSQLADPSVSPAKIDLCSQHEEGPVWREQGQGGRTGKVFEEQKQWPILC